MAKGYSFGGLVAALRGGAFLDVGTTTETLAAGDDSRIVNSLQKGNNLSELTDTGVARTNLGVYGKTEVWNRTEGDARYLLLTGGNISGSVALTGAGQSLITAADNSMMRVGNNGDIGFIKSLNSPGKIGVASTTPLVIAKSNVASNINPSDTWTTLATFRSDGGLTTTGQINGPSLGITGGGSFGSVTSGLITNNGTLQNNGNANVTGDLVASGQSFVQNLDVSQFALFRANTQFNGAMVVNNTVSLNNSLYLNSADWINKYGNTTQGSNYITGILHAQGRSSNQFTDIYHFETTGQYESLNFHVAGGSTDAYFQFRNTGQLDVPGIGSFGGSVNCNALRSNNSIQVGGAFYQNDGNITGSAWNGYLSNWIADNLWANGSAPGKLAAMGLGNLGTLALLRDNGGRYINQGDIVDGSSMSYSSCGEYRTGSPGGQWRALGCTNNKGGYDGDQVTLFIRIS